MSKKKDDETKVETISLRMTWVSTLPMLLVLLENGDTKGREYARKELLRMAQVADLAFKDSTQ